MRFPIILITFYTIPPKNLPVADIAIIVALLSKRLVNAININDNGSPNTPIIKNIALFSLNKMMDVLLLLNIFQSGLMQ